MLTISKSNLAFGNRSFTKFTFEKNKESDTVKIQNVNLALTSSPQLECPASVKYYTVDDEWAIINTPDPSVSNFTSNTSLTWGMSGGTSDYSVYPNTKDQMFNIIGQHAFKTGTTTMCTYAIYEGWEPQKTCHFDVTVYKITCPSDKTINTDQGKCTAGITFPQPVPLNLVLNDPLNISWEILDPIYLLSSGSNYPPQKTLDKGNYLIKYYFDQPSISVASEECQFYYKIEDNEDPVILCKKEIPLKTDPGVCSASSDISPTPVDNCHVVDLTWVWKDQENKVVSKSFNSGINNIGSRAYNKGTSTVIFSAWDDSGNYGECESKITVVDEENPILICPNNQTIKTDPELCSKNFKIVNPTTASDNCGIQTLLCAVNGKISVSPFTYDMGNPPNYDFKLGTSTVFFKAIDASNKFSVCSYNVTVVDNVKPKFTTCFNGLKTLVVPSGKSSIDFDLPETKATDNCDYILTWEVKGKTQAKSPIDGINETAKVTFNLGLSTVIFTAKDISNNSATCIYSINVTNKSSISSLQPGNWTVASTWAGGVVPGTSEDVQIASGHTVLVSEDAICNNLSIDGNLIVESGKTLTVNNELNITATDGSISKGASTTGQLVLADNSAQLNVLGQVSIGHKIVDLKYHLSSIPFETNIADILTGFTVAYYSELTGKWINLVKGQMLEQGKAYSIKNANNPLYPASTDLFFTAPNSTTLATGTITIPLTHTAGKGNGWNLVPNSYPCAANWKTMTTTASPTIYYWDGSKYVNYNKFNEENTGGTGIIPQGEGFFVYCPDEKNGCLLTMTNEDRLASNVSYTVAKKGSSTYPQIPNRLSLIVSGNGYTDQSVIAFVNDATSEYDVNYDAFKLFSTQADVPLLNSNSLSKQYSVNYLPADMVNQSKVQLEFTVGTAGDYTLNAENIGSFDATESIMLVDTKTNTSTDLRQTGYTFTSEVVKADQRFYVEFSGLPTSIKKQNLDNELNIFTDKDQIIVQNKTGLDAQGTVTVYDVLGKEITTRKLTSNTETRIDMNTQANAIYFVKVKTEDQTITKKVCITK